VRVLMAREKNGTPPASLELVTPAPASFKAPRGPVVNAAWIIRHYHTDPDTGEQLVTPKWVREHVPGKKRLSYNVVGWFRDDVVEHYERIRRTASV
jgi:hypothetical protein